MTNDQAPMTKECSSPNVRAASRQGKPLSHSALGFPWSLELGHWSFTSDWERTLMLHYEVPPEKLQPFVPFPLDIRNGKAYVSLVAFTMRGLKPMRGGRLAALAFRPIATHELLNVRTYVRHHGEPGIYFLAEWIPNLLSVLLGRPVFGLPYRWGRLRYLHDHEEGVLFGDVRTRDRRAGLRYRAKVGREFAPVDAGSLTEWLMERYTAFTEWLGWKRRFRVRHEPWPQCTVEAEVLDDSLLNLAGGWARYARLVGANYSPGVREVEMSAPQGAQTTNHKVQMTGSPSAS
jgi:uncharacterized protein YqjF (DUF2071 family)